MNKVNMENSTSGVLRSLSIAALFVLTSACAAQQSVEQTVQQTEAFQAPDTKDIPAGVFIFGSDAAEREYAYELDEISYGHTRTRDQKWYDSEPDKQTLSANQFHITTSPITNDQYWQFIKATNHPAPDVDQNTWQGYGLIHPYQRTLRHKWVNEAPPPGRERHPVVLVSYDDAVMYAQWLSKTTGDTWRLPTETEWVKAARGPDGWQFPWGDLYDASKLNSHDNGPFDTVDVGSASEPNTYGLVDAAGQVFEWTQTTQEARRAWVKGGSWDDKGCGVCRPSARHGRPKDLKHILIGFRLIKE